MNVGHPSNLPRIIALYEGMMNEKGGIITKPDLRRMREDLSGISVSDEDTKKTISDIYSKYGMLLEPHGAVAWRGLEEYLELNKNDTGNLSVSLETAHPAKFPDEIKQVTGTVPVLPPSLAGITDMSETFLTLENNYETLKELLLKNY
jgi:threonine synthase